MSKFYKYDLESLDLIINNQLTQAIIRLKRHSTTTEEEKEEEDEYLLELLFQPILSFCIELASQHCYIAYLT